jgi:flagellar biosynthesis/type III secretory pathway protein FliH
MGRIEKTGKGPAAPTGTTPAPTATATEIAAALVQIRAEAKQAAIILARKMAEKIVGHAVTVDATVMRDIAAHALAAARLSPEPINLRVHPDDLAMLQASRPEWLAELGWRADVTITADTGVGRYGCIVETSAGRLDARLETQLDALEQALRRVTAVQASESA